MRDPEKRPISARYSQYARLWSVRLAAPGVAKALDKGPACVAELCRGVSIKEKYPG